MTELTNLLPPDRLATLRREYFMRLVIVTVIALSGIAVGSGALLVPSYLYLVHEIQVHETNIQDLDGRLAQVNGPETKAELASLTSTATYLARLSTTSPATAAFRGVLAVPRTGITLTGLTYLPATHGADGKMTLTGTAATRESLRAYDDALSALPYVDSADLPISAFAKDSDIPFVISLTGTLSP